MNRMHEEIFEKYHIWYYQNELWSKTTFLGVPCLKSVCDLWNYQEILTELNPALVVEFGTYKGGSALFFAHIVASLSSQSIVLTVDHKRRDLDCRVTAHPRIEIMISRSTDSAVKVRISELRQRNPGPIFVILDSSHEKDHVLDELVFLRPILFRGDYLVVEDSNINGHPVLPETGPGPWEALLEYESRYPNDFCRDSNLEAKFGFTFAPRGYLMRR